VYYAIMWAIIRFAGFALLHYVIMWTIIPQRRVYLLPLPPSPMVDDAAEEAAERVAKCVKWSDGWAKANPDPVVADAIADGLVTLGCLPRSRLKRMLERETLEPESLTEGQMHYLNQEGMLDPEEAETVDDDGEEEEEADDGDGGRTSLSDLPEEEQERLVAKMEKEIEKQLAEMRASDADDGDGDDEETAQEAETADDGGEEREEADGEGDSDDDMIRASRAM